VKDLATAKSCLRKEQRSEFVCGSHNSKASPPVRSIEHCSIEIIGSAILSQKRVVIWCKSVVLALEQDNSSVVASHRTLTLKHVVLEQYPDYP
jgi:hypothetical protein